ncbi:UNVERIFIED_CONTAM: hypothetical protein FKN15_061041 [Acipenser sinensis]
MDQWLWYNPEPSRNRWDSGLEDLLGGLEEEGWCLACREIGQLVACSPFQEEGDLLPARKRKRRRGGHSRRLAKDSGPSPVCEMGGLPLLLPPERAPLPPPERAPQPERAPPERTSLPLPPEKAPLLPALLRELPLQAPVLLRAPARGVTKAQEQREPLPKSPDLPQPEGETLLPESEFLILGYKTRRCTLIVVGAEQVARAVGSERDA